MAGFSYATLSQPVPPALYWALLPVQEPGMPTSPSRAVLITGCSSGIGYHAAHFLQRAGFQVIASARRAEDVARLQAQGLTALCLDLADDASIHAAVDATLTLTGGRLYGLFNNGAYGQPYHQCQMLQ